MRIIIIKILSKIVCYTYGVYGSNTEGRRWTLYCTHDDVTEHGTQGDSVQSYKIHMTGCIIMRTAQHLILTPIKQNNT